MNEKASDDSADRLYAEGMKHDWRQDQSLAAATLARATFHQAATVGHSKAIRALAHMIFEGRGGSQDREQALLLLWSAFLCGDHDSLDELADIKIEDVDYSTINECKRELEHQKFLLKLLTKKDSFVRRALLNKNIPFLNSRMQFYLGVLGLQHKVEFTHELCASITQFGRLLDFGNLSAGQQARVNLALAFSFRDVLESLHKKINICLLDEVLDVGLDAIGIQNAARLLKKKARDDGVSMFIISHREEAKGIFDHNMVVQMTQGFSYIKEEDA